MYFKMLTCLEIWLQHFTGYLRIKIFFFFLVKTHVRKVKRSNVILQFFTINSKLKLNQQIQRGEKENLKSLHKTTTQQWFPFKCLQLPPKPTVFSLKTNSSPLQFVIVMNRQLAESEKNRPCRRWSIKRLSVLQHMGASAFEP